jgi:hypothetical protein
MRLIYNLVVLGCLMSILLFVFNIMVRLLYTHYYL